MYTWLFIGALAFADEKKKDDKKKEDDTEETEDKYAELTEKKEKIDGLFPLYRDNEKGEVLLEVRKSQLDKDFLYYSYMENGVLDAWTFRGRFPALKLIEFEKYYDRIDIVEQNTSFYFDPENPLHRAKDANISPSTLISASIKATKEIEGDEIYLIEFHPILLSKDLTRIEYSFDGDGFSLGSLSDDRSRILELKNYEANTDVLVEYVFHSGKPKYGGGREITDERNVHIKLYHSIQEAPQSTYTPRYDDFRVGYFTNAVDDQTSHSFTPYRDMIKRWNLVKKDPEAALSEPVEPIVWWMENTTPLEFREDIKAGVLKWNRAFEQAGFKNAIVVKQQPDDAEWDAGDRRYNVLRWTASPRPPFGGYGPSLSDPRTGEIIAADIMLEYIYMTNRVNYSDLIASISDRSKEKSNHHGEECMHGAFMQANIFVGMSYLEGEGAPESEKKRLLSEAVQHLVQHEVGHTLGLNHNMKASSAIPLDALHDMERAEKEGLVPSVMDYTPINLAPKGIKQGKFFSNTPGLYDVWAIQFGYTPSLADPEAEKKRQSELLAKSLDPMLTFGNDADDMRSPYGGIDPRTNVGDLSSDLVGWSDQMIDIAHNLEAQLFTKYKKEGESWEALRRGYYITRWLKVSSLFRTMPIIGGIHVERGVTEQFTEGVRPYTPVSKKEQMRALKFLCEKVFSDGALAFPKELLPYMQEQRRGFNFFWQSEDPKIHYNILDEQGYVLYRLLNPLVFQRLSDAQQYGGTMTAHQLIDTLTKAIFAADRLGSISDERKNLQLYYVEVLIEFYRFLEHGTDKAAVAHGLRLAKSLSSPVWLLSGNGQSVSHRKHLQKVLREW